jgi:hypothetical protein
LRNQLDQQAVKVSNRHWLRFTVRALLVAVVFICAYLGWQAKIVRDRKAMLKAVIAGGDQYGYVNPDDPFLDQPVIPTGLRPVLGPRPVVWLRQMPGDEAVGINEAPTGTSQSNRQTVTQLPRADVVSVWMADAPIVIRVEPHNLLPSPMPPNMDKSLINDLPSNRQTIRVD